MKMALYLCCLFPQNAQSQAKNEGEKNNNPEISKKRHVTRYIASTLENFKSHRKQVIHKKLSKLRGADGDKTNKCTLIL